MFCFVCRRYDRASSFCVGSTKFKLEVWLQKKRMPYFSDNRSRLRGEEDDGPAQIPGHQYRQLSLVHLMMPKMMMMAICQTITLMMNWSLTLS